MAEEENKPEQEESTEKPKSSNNMLMIIIIVVLVLLIIVGGVVAFLLLSSDDEQMPQTQQPAPIEQKVEKKQRRTTSSSFLNNTRKLDEIGVLYPLDTFTVNLKSDSGRRYLKCTMSLELSGEELSMELDAKAAVLRDRIIRILSSKTLEEISSKKGKAKVSQQIMDTLNSMISDGQIKGIYFTEFVIQ